MSVERKPIAISDNLLTYCLAFCDTYICQILGTTLDSCLPSFLAKVFYVHQTIQYAADVVCSENRTMLNLQNVLSLDRFWTDAFP